MIVVLRIGHRPKRDKRVSTHVGLVARAFGADKFILSTKDEVVEESIRKVLRKFGGSMEIVNGADWKKEIKNFKGVKIHLTMYGVNVDDIIDEIRKHEDIMVIVGAEKVPKEVYELADYNVAIGNQPHSEVSALAIFLDRYYEGKELKRNFYGYWRIIPNPRGKTVKIIPTEEECIKILKDVGCDDGVIKHSIMVKNIAVEIAKKCKKEIDMPILIAGALLHDVGRAVTHDIMHVVEGVKIAKRLGMPEEIVRIIERHIGAGVPKDEAIKLGLENKDYVPESLEEMIVCYADNLASAKGKMSVEEVVEEYRRKGLPHVAERFLELRRKICEVCEEDDI